LGIRGNERGRRRLGRYARRDVGWWGRNGRGTREVPRNACRAVGFVVDVVTPFAGLLDVRTESGRRPLSERNHGRDEQLHQAEQCERHNGRSRSLAERSGGSISPVTGEFHQMTGSTYGQNTGYSSLALTTRRRLARVG
jgi:hypothetical protein